MSQDLSGARWNIFIRAPHGEGYRHMLTANEIKRYSRHLLLPDVGVSGQQKLKDASVLCVGAGGLGSPLMLYLAAAGVGRIGIVDGDVVEISNLQRQIIHRDADVGAKKTASAAAKLRALNPEIQIDCHDAFLSAQDALEICGPYDVIVDGTDNFATRYLVNDTCVLLGKPNVHASIFRFEGQASVFHAEKGPCYRCLYPEPPPPGEVPSCAEGGVLGILPGLLGVIQATETIKLILGIGTSLVGRLLLVDALEMRMRELEVRKSPDCPICGPNADIHALIDYQGFCATTAPAATVQSLVDEISAVDAASMRNETAGTLLLDVRDLHEWDICRIEGAIHIPLADLPQRFDELDRDRMWIVYCLMGGRSRKATELLRDAGFHKLLNLSGGIRAWADSVDPAMTIY
jgi:molybdopterin/thiamine biosynthesis adenylyltransferase/rhodanese-related sulfurtransferase